MSGEQSADLIERRKVLEAQMKAIEDEAAELAMLEGDELVARYNPPPAVPEEYRGMDLTDTLRRGPRVASQVVVSRDGRPISR